MAITVSLRSSEGLVGLAGVSMEELADFDDVRYPYLRLIDPYGATVFSSHQMTAVLPELERLVVEKPSANLEAVLRLARRCSRDTQLIFGGD